MTIKARLHGSTKISHRCGQSINRVLLFVACAICSLAYAEKSGLESSYRFLVSDRDSGGVLYTATAAKLAGRQLPLSFTDSAEYWGEHVCQSPSDTCAVTDIYNAQTYTLLPQKNAAGDLQTERINIHNGANIYDAATWQIAVMLGRVRNQFELPKQQNAYTLISNQNQLLFEGYSGNASHPAPGQNRAITADNTFVYNKQIISEPSRAYVFRTLARSWLAVDPLINTRYADWIKTSALPALTPEYQMGKVTWTDWKPISGENAWAFLIGPLQAAYIHYVIDGKNSHVPFQDLSVQNALAILPTFAAMQAEIGAVYYAPAGTIQNQGDKPVDPYEVAVENSFSLYAGLKILCATLQSELAHDKKLSDADKNTIREALRLSDAMINGGTLSNSLTSTTASPSGGNRHTAGLLAFFKNAAWHRGEFIQGGRANAPTSKAEWVPTLEPKAVDVNTWGIAALGARQIDVWFGVGAAYQNWQQLKSWSGYGVDKTLWGVGFSNRDGNGIDAEVNYRKGIMSSEWTAGAITMVRELIGHYRTIPSTSADYGKAQRYIETLIADEKSMLNAIENLRMDNYPNAKFPGQPRDYKKLLSTSTQPYLYASRRYLIPFGWYSNPLPSTCATAWIFMLTNHYNPFVYGGSSQGESSQSDIP